MAKCYILKEDVSITFTPDLKCLLKSRENIKKMLCIEVIPEEDND